MGKPSQIITVDATLLHETERAYLFDTGHRDKKGKPIGAWIPKTMCEYEDGELQLPRWKAEEAGLV